MHTDFYAHTYIVWFGIIVVIGVGVVLDIGEIIYHISNYQKFRTGNKCYYNCMLVAPMLGYNFFMYVCTYTGMSFYTVYSVQFSWPFISGG